MHYKFIKIIMQKRVHVRSTSEMSLNRISAIVCFVCSCVLVASQLPLCDAICCWMASGTITCRPIKAYDLTFTDLLTLYFAATIGPPSRSAQHNDSFQKEHEKKTKKKKSVPPNSDNTGLQGCFRLSRASTLSLDSSPEPVAFDAPRTAHGSGHLTSPMQHSSPCWHVLQPISGS